MFNDIEIRRDFEEEARRPKYTCYKMYLMGEMIGVANYRLFNSQTPYWYIDELVISANDRGKGYGSYLLKDIINRMWSERKLPIHIYPTGHQIPKEEFIKWLTDRNFVEQTPMSQGQIICILQHPDSE